MTLRRQAAYAQAAVETLLDARGELTAKEWRELLDHLTAVVAELWHETLVDDLIKAT